MLKYFDHTFFKIVSGFIGILAMSLALFVLVGIYQEDRASTPANSQWSVESTVR